MADLIRNLPVDKTQPNHNDMMVVNQLFQQNEHSVKRIVFELKEPLLAGLLFFIFSLPFVDSIIHKVSSKPIPTIIIKTILVIVIFYFIHKFSLSRI